MSGAEGHSPLDPAIRAYYEAGPEDQRLATGTSQLEFARTQEIIKRFIPEPPSVVLDVGGGPGAYAIWLAGLGYEVHMIDPVPRLVEQARTRNATLDNPIASIELGDARELELAEGSVNVVLLLGPLYHLTRAEERRRALGEAERVLAPGGVLIAAAISRFASALDGLARDLLADPAFGKIMEGDLSDGLHVNETGKLQYFTTAFFHKPDELQSEIEAVGFRQTEVLGVEGPAWILKDFDDRWRDRRQREDILRVARALESESSIRGVSAHLLAVARKST